MEIRSRGRTVESMGVSRVPVNGVTYSILLAPRNCFRVRKGASDTRFEERCAIIDEAHLVATSRLSLCH